MKKSQKITRLYRIRNAVLNETDFIGKSKFLNLIDQQVAFLDSYKTDPAIEDLILSEIESIFNLKKYTPQETPKSKKKAYLANYQLNFKSFRKVRLNR